MSGKKTTPPPAKRRKSANIERAPKVLAREPIRVRRRPPKHKFAASLESAAAVLGLPVDVLKTAKRKGCQAFRSNSSVHLAELKEFIAANEDLYSGSDDTPNTAIEKAKDARAVRQIREHKLQVLRGNYLPIDQVKRTLTRIAIAAKNKILSASKTSVALGAAKSALTPEQSKPILDELEKRLHEALAELAGSDLGRPACPHCQKSI